MNMLRDYFVELYRGTISGWSRFWFSPADPATLGLIRIFAGAMLLYTHAIWSLDLESFYGAQGFVDPNGMAVLGGGSYAWSLFNVLPSTPSVIWSVHAASLVVLALFMVGFATRVTSILAFLITVSYANRVPLALFGLDDANAMLAMYLAVGYVAIGAGGRAYSVDRWLAKRRAAALPIGTTYTSANIAIRLMQIHLCIVYFFSGLGKLQGDTWWDGTAIWGAVANLEYQSFDLTWLANYPRLVNVFTVGTAIWELTYAALVWPRLTRPIVLFIAVQVHLGIALCMGMMTFGTIMIVANMAFISPWVVRRVIDQGIFRQQSPAKNDASVAGSNRPAAGRDADKRQPKAMAKVRA